MNLNFCQMFAYRKCSISIYNLPKTSFQSSTLTELKINVAILNDCLYLLDGSLDCLSKLIINVNKLSYYPIEMNNWVYLKDCF